MRWDTGKIANEEQCASSDVGEAEGRSNASGLTLVELLIAVGISALVMTASAFALAAGMRAYARIAAPNADASAELNFFRAVQADISSATPLNGETFSGDSKMMSFTRLASPTASTNDMAIALVEWVVTPGRGSVRTLTYLSADSEAVHASANPETARAGVTFAVAPKGFEYRGENAAQWQDAWTATNFPGQVRVGETVFTVWSSNFKDEEKYE